MSRRTDHNAKARAGMKRLRDQRLAAGLCIKCGGTPRPNRTTCLPCGRAHSLCAAQSVRRVYHARLDAGLCTHCGGQPAPGKTKCQDCLHKAHRAHRDGSKPRLTITHSTPATPPGRLTPAAEQLLARAAAPRPSAAPKLTPFAESLLRAKNVSDLIHRRTSHAA